MAKTKIKLGSRVKDKVTGIEGIAMGKLKHLTGCDQYCIQPDITEPNKIPEQHWLDVNRLEVVKEDAVVLDTTKDKGPCCQVPEGL